MNIPRPPELESILRNMPDDQRRVLEKYLPSDDNAELFGGKIPAPGAMLYVKWDPQQGRRTFGRLRDGHVEPLAEAGPKHPQLLDPWLSHVLDLLTLEELLKALLALEKSPGGRPDILEPLRDLRAPVGSHVVCLPGDHREGGYKNLEQQYRKCKGFVNADFRQLFPTVPELLVPGNKANGLPKYQYFAFSSDLAPAPPDVRPPEVSGWLHAWTLLELTGVAIDAVVKGDTLQLRKLLRIDPANLAGLLLACDCWANKPLLQARMQVQAFGIPLHRAYERAAEFRRIAERARDIAAKNVGAAPSLASVRKQADRAESIAAILTLEDRPRQLLPPARHRLQWQVRQIGEGGALDEGIAELMRGLEATAPRHSRAILSAYLNALCDDKFWLEDGESPSAGLDRFRKRFPDVGLSPAGEATTPHPTFDPDRGDPGPDNTEEEALGSETSLADVLEGLNMDSEEGKQLLIAYKAALDGGMFALRDEETKAAGLLRFYKENAGQNGHGISDAA